MSASNWSASARVRAESARWPLNLAKPGILADHSAKAVSHSASEAKRELRSQVSWGLTLLRGGRDPADDFEAAAFPLVEARGGVMALVFGSGRRAWVFFFNAFLVEVLAMAGCGNSKRDGGQ